jgi:prepilin-type N-terminal cleavage/methylation domain-containing protein
VFPAAVHLRHIDREHGRSLIEIATVLAIFGVVAAMSVPLVANALAYFRVSGDARSISNAIAVVKIRAASSFTQTRLSSI